MRTREEIERVLREELERARRAHDQAKETFSDIVADLPSGLPPPDGGMRIDKAGRAECSTLEAYAQAIREFNEFVIHGTVPERLKERSEEPDSSAEIAG